MAPAGLKRAGSVAIKVGMDLLKKKILICAGPTLLIILLVLSLIVALCIIFVGVLGNSRNSYEAVYGGEKCLDVGSSSPRVVAASGGASGGGGGGGPKSGKGPLGMPVDDTMTITSPYGWRVLDGGPEFHDGLDFSDGDSDGKPIYSPADGVVLEAGPASGYGNWIRIMHDIDGEKVETIYGHMWDGHMYVKGGDKVEAGQHIADIGNNGRSFGAHLHFGVYPGGWSQGGGVDPMPWLSKFSEGKKDDDKDEKIEAAGETITVTPGEINLVADTTILAQGGREVTAADWEKLAQCESGGNWSINTGNGYFGGLQFSASTWKSHGGEEFAPTADKAGREEQMEVANRVLKSQGWGAWPACTQSLTGLRGLKPAPEGSFLGTAGELKPVPSKVGSEAKLQVETIRLMRAIHQEFSEVKTIVGWREADGYNYHYNGQAIDVMIDNWDTPEGKTLGDAIVQYVLDNAEEMNLDHIMWRQENFYTGYTLDGGQPEADRGSPTQNHFDHVHISVGGGGYPTDATRYEKFGTVRSPDGSGSQPGSSPAEPSPAEESDLPGLLPYELSAGQLAMSLNVEQQASVKAIIAASKESKLEEGQQPRAAMLATMLAAQQSNLVNLDGKADKNKVGIFAEAPSFTKGRARLTNPKIVARDFYKDLRKEYGDDTSWMTDPAAEVLTRIYPERASLEVELAKYELLAADSVAQLWDARGAQKGAMFQTIFEDVEACSLGSHPRSGSAAPGAALEAGAVPADWVEWFEKGATECDVITAPVLAAQAFAEGGFQEHEYRQVGIDEMTGEPVFVGGLVQFRKETWDAYGAEVDDEGQAIGPPGSGDHNKISDAVMAQARLNCEHARQIQGWLDDGSVKGDLLELTLGAYLTGPGGIKSAGGIDGPAADENGSTARSYSEKILNLVPEYTDLEASKNSAEKTDEDSGSKVGYARDIAVAANFHQGVKYRLGGGDEAGPNDAGQGDGEESFDSAGLARRAVSYATDGKVVPPSSVDGYANADGLEEVDDPKPGDLVVSGGQVYILKESGLAITTDGELGEVSEVDAPADGTAYRVTVDEDE